MKHLTFPHPAQTSLRRALTGWGTVAGLALAGAAALLLMPVQPGEASTPPRPAPALAAVPLAAAQAAPLTAGPAEGSASVSLLRQPLQP